MSSSQSHDRVISHNSRYQRPKRALTLNIKQAIQGLFTAGTSPERKRSAAKRGLKRYWFLPNRQPWFVSHKPGQSCPNNPEA